MKPNISCLHSIPYCFAHTDLILIFAVSVCLRRRCIHVWSRIAEEWSSWEMAQKLSKTCPGSMKRDRTKENRSGWIFVNLTFCWYRSKSTSRSRRSREILTRERRMQVQSIGYAKFREARGSSYDRRVIRPQLTSRNITIYWQTANSKILLEI